MKPPDGSVPPAAVDSSRPAFIVGIGASAGGLEALEALLSTLRLESMAVIVVQHLLPTHDSALGQILARATSFPVATAEDGMAVAPGCIYVIPPNAWLEIAGGRLRLSAQAGDDSRRGAVDLFFRSLAGDQGERAIGVVLSGTGSDGTLGLQAIKEAGGLTFVQEPSSARFDGMPRAAFDSGWADYCGSPIDIGHELMKVRDHPDFARREPSPLIEAGGLRAVLGLIRATFGLDLEPYKPTTIERRTERRMALHKLADIDDYVTLLSADPAELRALYRDLLIGVTTFFRDHDPFAALAARVLPEIAAHKRPGSTIRVWVPACSSGEEAYSIAITILEFLDAKAQDLRVQIFATDVDEESIQQARRGIYAKEIALDVSAERLHRFFVRTGDEYRINRRVRDTVVFSTQDVTKDAPFSRVDLVSCRNLLIYLQPPMQRRVLRVFHYALQATGFLLLGNSESIGECTDLFDIVDRKNKMYQCKHAPGHAMVAISAPTTLGDGAGGEASRAGVRPAVNLAALADRKVLELYGPAGVVVDEQLDILHFRGRTGAFLEPAPGAPTLNVLRLARPELQPDLRRALHEAGRVDRPVTVAAHITDGEVRRDFKLEVLPILDPETKRRCLLVLFHAPHIEEPLPPAAAGAPADARVHDLELELLLAKEYLHTAVGELETTNEELKSSNEELQSSNEELQSTNEELETSKEELHSTNEELRTMNEELQNRMTELQQANDDLHNVLTGVDNAVVIAGKDLCIRRFTHAAERLLALSAADIGRPLGLVERFVGALGLDARTADVIDSLRPVDEEVQCADRRWYLLRILPYQTTDGSVDGAVVVLGDIDVRKRSLQRQQDAAEYAAKFLDLVDHPLAIVDARLRITWVNEPFYRVFNVVAEETLGSTLGRVGSGHWDDPELAARLQETIDDGTTFRDLRVRGRSADGRGTTYVSASRIPQLRDEGALVLLTFEERP